MTTVSIKVIGASEAALSMRAASAELESALSAVVRRSGTSLVHSIQARASGRPGPRAITGAYRRSWTKQMAGKTTCIVGTNAPQARRLEYGFHGADRIGRVYNQPPYPHVEPALAKFGPLFVAGIEDVLAGVVK